MMEDFDDHRTIYPIHHERKIIKIQDGKDELIAELNRRLSAQADLIKRLREGLVKLEWFVACGHDNVLGIATESHYCPICRACQEDGYGHDEDCWLDGLIK